MENIKTEIIKNKYINEKIKNNNSNKDLDNKKEIENKDKNYDEIDPIKELEKIKLSNIKKYSI